MNLDKLLQLLSMQGFKAVMLGDEYLFTKEQLETIIHFIYSEGYRDCVNKFDLEHEFYKK